MINWYLLTGFPNFDILSNIIPFDLPTIDFGFDPSDQSTDFNLFNWGCASQVGDICNAINVELPMSCDAALSDYYPDVRG